MEWEREAKSLREHALGRTSKLLQLETALRQQTHESRTATAALADKCDEVARLRAEKVALTQQLKSQAPGMADYEDKIASQQEQLERSEQHREEVARKLGKARKKHDSLLAQNEREIEMLNYKLDQMEDEIGSEIQKCLDLEATLAEAQQQRDDMQRELGELMQRRNRRTAIQPEGIQELRDQLEMAADVRETLSADIANLETDLVQAKLTRAQEQEERELLKQKLRKSDDKRQTLALQLTKLEVKLYDLTSGEAEKDESIAEAFKQVMKDQESQLQQLRAEIAELRDQEKQLKAQLAKVDSGPKNKWRWTSL